MRATLLKSTQEFTTLNFTIDHAVIRKRNQLYFVPIEKQDVCLVYTPPEIFLIGNVKYYQKS